jgi:hypothetical protein
MKHPYFANPLIHLVKKSPYFATPLIQLVKKHPYFAESTYSAG